MGNSSSTAKNKHNNVAIWPFRQPTALLLIRGYTREIERLLHSSQIIPIDIYIIIKSYYPFSNNLLFMTYAYGTNHEMILNSRKSASFWPKLTTISPMSSDWRPGECGLFLKPNLTIPRIAS
eukprot:409077_1